MLLCAVLYIDDSTRRKMGLGDLWPHSREDSKAGLCHFFYFAVTTSAARVRRPPRLFSWITVICAAAVVQLQD